MIEKYGPNVLSETQLERARVASAHGKRVLPGAPGCRDKAKSDKPDKEGIITSFKTHYASLED